MLIFPASHNHLAASAASVIVAIGLSLSSAQASLVISKQATRNVNCSGGICSAVAPDAVLSVNDVKTMLRAGDLTVQAGPASDIRLSATVKWTKKTLLTLNAATTITFSAPVRVEGKGSVALVASEDSFGPRLAFIDKGSVTFLHQKSQLLINGESYKLALNLADLNNDFVANFEGSYALGVDYDAASDGVYQQSPINQIFSGHFEGLGHIVSNLQINNSGGDYIGLFAELSRASGTSRIRDIGIKDAKITAGGDSCVGGLAGLNQGHVSHVFASGSVVVDGTTLDAGGLIGCNIGSLDEAQASVDVTGNVAGGLVGILEDGDIENSFATGNAQGIVGLNPALAGGLVGNGNSGTIASSYSTGQVNSAVTAGGSIGSSFLATYSDVYWDTTTSGTQVGCGEGSCAGVTGLTTAQLQAGLPVGFDPSMWKQTAQTNNGLPYLKNVPPPD